MSDLKGKFTTNEGGVKKKHLDVLSKGALLQEKVNCDPYLRVTTGTSTKFDPNLCVDLKVWVEFGKGTCGNPKVRVKFRWSQP